MPRERSIGDEETVSWFYPSWRETINRFDADTICVPTCLDVQKSYYKGSTENLSPQKSSDKGTLGRITGQNAEIAFLTKIQNCKLGGVLVAGLKTTEIECKTALMEGDWDAIFFHQKRGIFVVEVKGAQNDQPSLKNKAIKQLDKMIKNLKDMWQEANDNMCFVPIFGVICFPFTAIEDKDANSVRHEDITFEVMDKEMMDNAEAFEAFFVSKQDWSIENFNASIIDDFQKFIAFSICQRSDVYVSFSANAMQIARWIEDQNYQSNEHQSSTVLTAEQLEIIETKEKCISISGAPGTGKTLIIFLKALKAARTNKKGNVVILVNEPLIAKYEQYFHSGHDGIKRKPLILEHGSSYNPEDDLFFDETAVDKTVLDELEKRAAVTGTTTAAFTGLYDLKRAATKVCQYYDTSLKDYKKFDHLKRVLRATRSTFKVWGKYFEPHFKLGHNITGIPVKPISSAGNIQQAAQNVLSQIELLLPAPVDKSEDRKLAVRLKDIAVLTANNSDAKDLRKIISNAGIDNDIIAHHLRDQDVIAVDCYQNAPSFEWPFVFVIFRNEDEQKVLPLAASRAIGCLFLLEVLGTSSRTSNISSPSLPPPPPPTSEELKKMLESAQRSLKEIYSTKFRNVNPFSLPFTFDIKNTWVSLALKEDAKSSQATEDHAKLLQKALERAKMLIIEGDPATGKTSLMRRLAYEWAKGKQELLHYDLLVYGEFREVREKTFKSIADLVFGGLEEYLDGKDIELLQLLLNNKQFCQQNHTLVLLDGYDESSLDKQCTELSSYLTGRTIKRALLYNAVITTRKGFLSNLRGREGRFVFAEVLGFTTKQQKEKYILSHFLSSQIDNQKNIAAVHSLLDSNENLNKLAETPLFLTFICLVHERIVDGTLLELYCNIIWWLIDRHQQDFPDRDIPALFGFQNGSGDKFEIIQDHYLHFPQLHHLGNMALRKLEENVFKATDYAQFNLQPIIEQVGLLRKEKKHDNSFKIVTSFFFPHRTIQEFLAAFYCFCSNDPTYECLVLNSKLDTKVDGKMYEIDRLHLRIALSDKLPVHPEKRRYYFERITDIEMDISFDAFSTPAGYNYKLLNWLLLQCTNVQYVWLIDHMNRATHARNMLNDTSEHNESTIISKMSGPKLFSFSGLTKLHSLIFGCYNSECTFEANSQLSFTNCPSLKNMIFQYCKIQNSTIVGIAALPAIDTVAFRECKIDLAAWQSITDQIKNSSVKCLLLKFRKDFNKALLFHLQKCSNVEKIEITIEKYTIFKNELLSFSNLVKLHSVKFNECAYEANSQLSFMNCPSLTNLYFSQCEMKSSTIVGITTLPVIDTMKLDKCSIDLAAWQSITDQIKNSSVKCLHLEFRKDFNKELLFHLQKCSNVEKMEIIIEKYTIFKNDLLSFSNLVKLHSMKFNECAYEADSQLSFIDLFKLHSLTFVACTFSANSQLSFTNCPSLKNLKFDRCEIESSTQLGIATLPAIDTVEFDERRIDLATWQSITDQISSSNVKCLHLPTEFFVEETYPRLMHHLQKCERIQQITVKEHDLFSILNCNEESVSANLALTAQKLPALTSITISDVNGRRLDDSRRLSERSRELIEKDGQQRNPQFSIKYVE